MTDSADITLFVAPNARGQVSSAWSNSLPDVTTHWLTTKYGDPIAQLRELCSRCQTRRALWVIAETALPPYWWTRLRESGDCAWLTCSHDAHPDACPFPDERPDWSSAQIDALCNMAGQNQLQACANIAGPLHLIDVAVVAPLIAQVDSLPSLLTALTSVDATPMLLDSLFVSDPDQPGWARQKEDPRDPLPAHALSHLQHVFSTATSPDISAYPTWDDKPVLLHITHSWGGGIERWLRDFVAADHHHHHLILHSQGRETGYLHGQKLRLEWACDTPVCLREWTLSAPIASTVTHHPEVQEILQFIRKRYQVAQLLVSSLIGHSLDVFTQHLTVAVVAHDYYPAWPHLNVRFDQSGQWQSQAPDRAELFPQNNPGQWQQLRHNYLKRLVDSNAVLIAPDTSVHRNLKLIDSRFADLNTAVIPHGCDTWDTKSPLGQCWKAGERLRLVILGQFNRAKGADILDAALDDLTEFADVYLLGCGRAGMRFFGRNHVHVQLRYDRESLPERVAEIQPHAALLLSTVSETFNYTLSELQALGIASIAARSGALGNRIHDNKTGVLIKPDAKALIAAAHQIQDHPDHWQSMHSQAFALQRRPLQSMVEDYLPFLPDQRSTARTQPQQPTALALQWRTHLGELRRQQQQSDMLSSRINSLQEELERRAEWASNTEKLAAKRTQWAKQLEQQLTRTQQALDALDNRYKERTAWAKTQISSLEVELKKRTQWAQDLDDQLVKSRTMLEQHEQELKQRAQWAKELDSALEASRIEVSKISADVQRQQKKIHKLTTQVNVEHALVRERTDWALSLDAQISEARSIIDQLNVELRERGREYHDVAHQLTVTREQHQHAEERMNELIESTSWKITKPFRFLARKTRGAKNRLVFKLRGLNNSRKRFSRSLKIRGWSGTVQRVRQEFRHDGVPQVDTVVLPTDLLPFRIPTSDNPVVSIVIPVYGEPRHTYHCLATIAQQASDTPFEVVVVDDCSPDEDTPRVLKRIAGIRVLRNPVNQGFIDSCNRGADMAKGEYVLFLNNDTAGNRKLARCAAGNVRATTRCRPGRIAVALSRWPPARVWGTGFFRRLRLELWPPSGCCGSALQLSAGNRLRLRCRNHDSAPGFS